MQKGFSEDTTPKINYAAHLLRRMIDPAGIDPIPADIARLQGPLFDVVMSVLSEGRDKERRKTRMLAELTARDLQILEEAVKRADSSADLLTLQTSSQWEVFDLADVAHEDIPKLEWIVKYFLHRPSLVVFFGKPKHKKTLAVLDMCNHIAIGDKWMSSPGGRDGIEVTAARVVWLDLENGPRMMKRRMQAFSKALGVETPRGWFKTVSMPDPWIDLSREGEAAEVIERIKAIGEGTGVIVLDHLSQVFGSVDENSPLASAIMDSLRRISEATNTAIILIHHAKKGQGKDGGAPEDMLRGSGAILAGVDGAFLVERDSTDKDQVTIKPVAVRGPDAPIISATFTYEQDENLDLTSARFWRIAYRSIAARAQDAIIQALQKERALNHTNLRAKVKEMDTSLSDANIREAIARLEGGGEIVFSVAAKGAKIYKLKESEDE